MHLTLQDCSWRDALPCCTPMLAFNRICHDGHDGVHIVWCCLMRAQLEAPLTSTMSGRWHICLHQLSRLCGRGVGAIRDPLKHLAMITVQLRVHEQLFMVATHSGWMVMRASVRVSSTRMCTRVCIICSQ
jgi:hypothetical protein